MIATENCAHASAAPIDTLAHLHDSQAGPGRHKCTVCAYAEGYRYGFQHNTPRPGTEECQAGQRAPRDMLDGLPDSQAGSGRHKCCVCAYHEGFAAARAQVAPLQSN